METISTSSKQSSMLAQVAQSKGTEWMVSNYNTWQQRSPLLNMAPTKEPFLNQLNVRLTQKVVRPGKVMAHLFGSLFY